jgi:hypothetical protein
LFMVLSQYGRYFSACVGKKRLPPADLGLTQNEKSQWCFWLFSKNLAFPLRPS